MVERIHLDRPETFVYRVRIPSLPHGRGTLIDTIKPRRTTALQKQIISLIVEPELRECRAYNARSNETGAQCFVIIRNKSAQSFHHILPLGGIFTKIELQRKQVCSLALLARNALCKIAILKLCLDCLEELFVFLCLHGVFIAGTRA